MGHFGRAVGTPPGPEATKADRLRWLRRMYYRWYLPILIVVVIVAVATRVSGLWLAPLGVAGTLWVVGFASVNMQLLRERGRTSHNG